MMDQLIDPIYLTKVYIRTLGDLYPGMCVSTWTVLGPLTTTGVVAVASDGPPVTQLVILFRLLFGSTNHECGGGPGCPFWIWMSLVDGERYHSVVMEPTRLEGLELQLDRLVYCMGCEQKGYQVLTQSHGGSLIGNDSTWIALQVED